MMTVRGRDIVLSALAVAGVTFGVVSGVKETVIAPDGSNVAAEFRASSVTSTIDLSNGRTCFIFRSSTGTVDYATWSQGNGFTRQAGSCE